jgi:copper chaperone CopZ
VEAEEKVEPVKPAPPAEPVERKLAVDGMSCKGCAATVRTALMSVEGVKDAKVVFAEGQATIQCDPSVSADKLIKTVENWELGGVKQSYKAQEILQ